MIFLRQRAVSGSVAILLLAAVAVTFYGFHVASEEAEAWEINLSFSYKGFTLNITIDSSEVLQAIRDFIAWVDDLLDGNDCNADGNGCSCDPCECDD